MAGTLTPSLTDELRKRIQAWNTIWQNVLNPQKEIRWPHPDIGRQWIDEGESLVVAVQAEVGPAVRVVEGFAAYDPDASPEGA